jgi:hypothetical protein
MELQKSLHLQYYAISYRGIYIIFHSPRNNDGFHTVDPTKRGEGERREIPNNSNGIFNVQILTFHLLSLFWKEIISGKLNCKAMFHTIFFYSFSSK